MRSKRPSDTSAPIAESPAPFLTALKGATLGVLLTLSCLISAFWISWQGLAQLNFAYSLGYDVLNIDQHIQRYGPSNRYRQGFELTTREQHQELFAAIVTAIQHGGQGLPDITYTTPGYNTDGHTRVTLLREPEVEHLQDVANLITLFDQAAIVCLVLLLVLTGYYHWKKRTPPTLKHIAFGTLATLALVGITLLIVGPTQTFYWLHTQIFPEDHQWFFYYQESLMTTLMKAPDLFGFIAGVWALVALILFGLGQWALHSILPAAEGQQEPVRKQPGQKEPRQKRKKGKANKRKPR